MTLHTPIGTRGVVWPLAMAAVVVFAALLFALFGGGGRAGAAADCKFVLGFKELHAMIPDTVGDCLENELHHPGKGVTLQRTKNGVLTWQKATNHTSFTDGTHTWVVGPLGLQQRLTTERFDWERELTAPPEAATEAEAQTIAYVKAAIARYEQDGLEATAAYYNNPASIEGDRALVIVSEGERTVLASALFPSVAGSLAGPRTVVGALIGKVTEEGLWTDRLATSPVTNQKEPRRFYYLRHDGLIFGAGHSVLRENLADVVVDYVNNAIAYYEREGLEATVAYYNSQESVDGPLYLFLMDANDIYLVHPIFAHLIGTDIKDVVGSNGYELGKEIAKATEAGHWVEYLWPNPVTEVEEAKTTWVIRHAGLIFASGYYTADTEAEEPAWKTADPREYTVEYVQRAIERYDRDGLEAMAAYYNSVASFEGQFYLFATDANDIYFVHPLFARLRGTDIKDVVGSDGYELGKEIAKATEAGHWIEYLWPHPVTLREVPKIAYAIRHDGRIFASGYYPSIEDPAGRTRAYVQEAIDRYEREGLAATVAYYNSPESVDGQWHLTLLDENDIYLVNPLLPVLVGKDIKRVGERILNSEVRRALVGATAEGQWVRYQVPNPRATGTVQRHQWVVRHDGLTFSSGYYEEE